MCPPASTRQVGSSEYLAGVEVVCAMRGRGMHRPGAGVVGDVGGQNAQNSAVEEWMLEVNAVESRALEAGELFDRPELAGCGHLRGQFSGNDVDGLSVEVSHPFLYASCGSLRKGWGTGGLWRFEGHVFEIGMEGHGH